MERLFADTKPTADVEYLSSAIIADAVFNKFRDMFGRDPVEKTSDAPMKIVDARIPTMIADSVDPQIARILKASAVEASRNASGEIPQEENATLLYTIVDEEPAEIALDSVEEYRALDTSVADSVAHAVSESEDINIEEGVAHVSPALSTLLIGIFADNTLLGEEFQYRLEQAGGNKLSGDEKVAVFDQLYNDLPGGDDLFKENLREELMKVVGLTSEVTPENTPEPMKAPGPEPEAESAGQEEPQTASVKEVVSSLIEKFGFHWDKIRYAVVSDYGDSELGSIRAHYVSCALSKEGLDTVILADNNFVEEGSYVGSVKQAGKFFVAKMLNRKDGGTEFILRSTFGEDMHIASHEDIVIS